MLYNCYDYSLPWWFGGKDSTSPWVQSLVQGDPLEKEMATHSRTFAWEISWTEEPGGPQSMGLQTCWTRLSK